MKISVVIPSYNRKDCVRNLLADLQLQTHPDFEIIVVDDCSPDDTNEMIQSEFPQVILLQNEENSGPAVSRNHGIKVAKGEVIVGLDSDVTLPHPDTLADVSQTFQNLPDIHGLAFRILNPDGKTDDAPRWWHPKPIHSHATRRFDTDYFSGTAYAFRKAPLEQAGLYPEILYMHYEEVELAWRFLDEGFRLVYEPSLSVIHHANPVSRRSRIKVFYKPRNQQLLAIRNLPFAAAIKYALPRAGFQMLSAIKNRHFLSYLEAMKSTIHLAPDCWKERKCLSRKTLQLIRQLKTS